MLTDNIALVTGAGAGLGAAIAGRLAEEGATVLLVDIDGAAAEATAKELSGRGLRAEARQLDVTDSAAVDDVFTAVLTEHGRLDISVHNAGVGRLAEAWEETDEDWNRLLSVNLTGVFYCQRAALRIMTGQRSGAVVNMSSVCGRLGRPYVSPAYAAAKAGVVGLTMSAAQSVAEFGVRVNAIAPGPIRTELQSSFDPEKLARLQQGFPLGWGEPSDVASGVLYLASDLARWQTGTVLDLNGGHLMG